jgi:hypothetical protein
LYAAFDYEYEYEHRRKRLSTSTSTIYFALTLDIGLETRTHALTRHPPIDHGPDNGVPGARVKPRTHANTAMTSS